jgi:hypothetical protein
MSIFDFSKKFGGEKISKFEDETAKDKPLEKDHVGEPLDPNAPKLEMENAELNVDYASLIEEIVPELQALLGRGIDDTDRQIALDTLESTREVLVLSPKERAKKIFDAINLGRLDKAA